MSVVKIMQGDTVRATMDSDQKEGILGVVRVVRAETGLVTLVIDDVEYEEIDGLLVLDDMWRGQA